MVSALLTVSLCGHAFADDGQSRVAKIDAKPDPYQLAIDVTTRKSGNSSPENTLATNSRQFSAKPAKQDLKYNRDLKLDQKEIQAIIGQYTRAFGKPQSIRGENYVWRVKNPNADMRQSRVVTIILNTDAKSGGKLVIDRAAAGIAKITKKRRNIKALQKSNGSTSRKQPMPTRPAVRADDKL